MRYAWLIVLAVVATTGCNQAELKKALAEAKSAEAQKDSLLTEVLETTQFVSDINSELATHYGLDVNFTGAGPDDWIAVAAFVDEDEIAPPPES